MDEIPTAVNLTTYSGGAEDFMLTPLDNLAAQIAAGALHIQIGKVFHLDEIRSASLHGREQRGWQNRAADIAQ